MTVPSEARSSAQQFMKEQLKGKSAIEIKPQIMGALSSAADLIDRKAGADAVGFKSWLKSTAQSVAEAAKEGGFLGFGGVAVSEAEKASIDEVARSLRI